LINWLRGLRCHGGCHLFGNGCGCGAGAGAAGGCAAGGCDAAPSCGC
jgi:hypothetical protein